MSTLVEGAHAAWDDSPDEAPYEGDSVISTRGPQPARPPSAPLTTAAQMHSTATAELQAVDPDVFHQGMIVKHPEYGLGKVVALSGSGARRSATVAFASAAGQKRFMLQQSQLRPAVGE